MRFHYFLIVTSERFIGVSKPDENKMAEGQQVTQDQPKHLTGSEFVDSIPWRHAILDHTRRDLLRIIESCARNAGEISRSTFVIAISGQSTLGKSAFSYQLAHYIGRPGNVVDLDCYLKPREWRLANNVSGPAPEANDLKQATQDIEELLRGRKKYFPYYSHESGKTGEAPQNPQLYQFTREEIEQKAGYTVTLLSRDYLILEGVSPFYGELANLANLKIFITTLEGLQLALLDKTQVEERGYTSQQSFRAATQKIDDFRRVAPMLEKMADIVILCDRNYNYEIARIKGVLGERYPRISPSYDDPPLTGP